MSFDRALSLQPNYAAGMAGNGISILDGRKIPFQVNASHYGAAIADHGKGMVLRPTDLARSTECFEQALSSLMASGAPAAGKRKAAPPRYPFEQYPLALHAVIKNSSSMQTASMVSSTGGTLLGPCAKLI